jgi:hypothetical protein
MDLKKPRKTKRLPPIRMTEQEYNRLVVLSELYAGGNLSLWITWAAINGPRKFITKKDLEPKPKKRRPK